MFSYTPDNSESLNEEVYFDSLKQDAFGWLSSTNQSADAFLSDSNKIESLRDLYAFYKEPFISEIRKETVSFNLKPWIEKIIKEVKKPKSEIEKGLSRVNQLTFDRKRDELEITSEILRKRVLVELRAVVDDKQSFLSVGVEKRIEKNDKVFIYHGEPHITKVRKSVIEIADKMTEKIPEEEKVLLELISLFHDYKVGDEDDTPNNERDEVVSARVLKDAIYKQFDLFNATPERRAVFDDLIQEMQVAIIATTVNKNKALPIGVNSGESTISQFDLSNKMKGNEDLTNDIVIALGYSDLEGEEKIAFQDKLKEAEDNPLAMIICSADLGYFGSEIKEDEGEDEFWEMAFRYGVEIGALSVDNEEGEEDWEKEIRLSEELRGYLKNQIDYLKNYKFPHIEGVSDNLEKNKEARIKWIEDRLNSENMDLEKRLRYFVEDDPVEEAAAA